MLCISCGSNIKSKTTDDNQSSDALELTIGHYKSTCWGEAEQLCFLVKEEKEQELFYEEIKGFEYQWGYTYRILVKRVTTKEPPLDGSTYHYKLVKVLSKKEVLNPPPFEVKMNKYFLKESQHLLPSSKIHLIDGTLISFQSEIIQERFFKLIDNEKPFSVTFSINEKVTNELVVISISE